MNPALSSAASAPPMPPPQRHKRHTRDRLAVAWLHGRFSCGVAGKNGMRQHWHSSTPVSSLADFAQALDAGSAALDFRGTEILLSLGHEAFVHQSEVTPPLAEAALRPFLQQRLERNHGEASTWIWAYQALASSKREQVWLIHRLPTDFLRALNQLLVDRRLELTAVYPTTLPLLAHDSLIVPSPNGVVLTAAACGDAIQMTVNRVDGTLLLARTLLSSWSENAERVATEINRSVLYIKQQFGVSLTDIYLFGPPSEKMTQEVRKRTPSEITLSAIPFGPADWLGHSFRQDAKSPANLLATHHRRRKRVAQVRFLLTSGAWALAALVGLSVWKAHDDWQTEERHLRSLASRLEPLTRQRDALRLRNQEMMRYRDEIAQIDGLRQPSVPRAFLIELANSVPAELQVSDFSLQFEPGERRWKWRIEGEIQGDEASGADVLALFERNLQRTSLRPTMDAAARSLVANPVQSGSSPYNRFVLEGGCLE